MLREKLAFHPKLAPFAISQRKVHIALDTSQFLFFFFFPSPIPPFRNDRTELPRAKQREIGKKLKCNMEEGKQGSRSESKRERERKRSDSVFLKKKKI